MPLANGVLSLVIKMFKSDLEVRLERTDSRVKT
jgi:hypothetical protein